MTLRRKYMTKNVELRNIAEIRVGLVTNRKKSAKQDKSVKTYKLLTLKSFNVNGRFNKNNLEDFYSNEDLDNKYLTKKGDIIIRLSHPNTAIIIDETNEGLLISSLFVVIRLNNDIINPAFLCIYLNSDEVSRYYQKGQVGISKIRIIKTSYISKIKVPLVSLEKQKEIIEINNIFENNIELLESLTDKKKTYKKGLINKLLKEGE
jgi:restriction endonuclease S subunit